MEMKRGMVLITVAMLAAMLYALPAGAKVVLVSYDSERTDNYAVVQPEQGPSVSYDASRKEIHDSVDAFLKDHLAILSEANARGSLEVKEAPYTAISNTAEYTERVLIASNAQDGWWYTLLVIPPNFKFMSCVAVGPLDRKHGDRYKEMASLYKKAGGTLNWGAKYPRDAMLSNWLEQRMRPAKM
jgi:hypothetical protein